MTPAPAATTSFPPRNTLVSLASVALIRTYNYLKPFISRGLRLQLRRHWASYRRRTNTDIWPIDPAAGDTPPGWPGWPGGKRFGLVLTHDVEGPKGLSRVEQLMNLEAKYGFRSSINFVPEGDYVVTDAMRQMLGKVGFEVGVHGLEHDGKLYRSKSSFASKAAHIRSYLRRWNATGFRSPLMQHRLSWLHELGVEYDCSTFDTDPFEPQPDGAGTIFPFWVTGSEGCGYVELPYTLCQDFTLFVVLREPDIDIWKKKLDWVVERGGMALLNTHPDYMRFEGKPGPEEFPVSFYEEFLQYAKEKYEGQFWHALPSEVSRFYCAAVQSPLRNSRQRVGMVVHSNYESDGRVRRYAEALVKRGDRVDVIALCGDKTQIGKTEINGVTVYRIQYRERNERHKWTYAHRLVRFLFESSSLLTHLHSRVRYDLIHVHNVPDFLVFAAWYPRITGAKLILDIHDIVPELFASKFSANHRGLYVRALKLIEKASAAFVDHVIVSNHLWHEKLVSRSVPRNRCSVFVNHIDPAVFNRRTRTRNDGRIVIVFPGGLQWHQGVDIAIRAFSFVKVKVPSAEFHIYGDSHKGRNELTELARTLGVGDSLKWFDVVPIDKIPDVIANADIGVVPKRADSFGNEAYSTKIMEFMSQGVPVVVSRTRIDTFYYDESTVRFFPSGDHRAMAEAMVEVIEKKPLRDGLIANGLKYADEHNWSRRKQEYFDLVDSLVVERFVREPTPVCLAEQA